MGRLRPGVGRLGLVVAVHHRVAGGHGGAREEAEKLGVPFLGEVPLHLDIRTTSDSGRPIVVDQPDSPHTQVYKNIAGRVWKQLSANQRGARKAPNIVVQ